MENQTGFDKRIYGPRAALADLAFFYDNSQEIRSAMRHQEISKAFGERIMLAVTAVNGCRYCSYAHTKAALKQGLTQEEIDRLLAGEVGQVEPHEAPALLFAQHYAETGGRPDREMVLELEARYGAEMARDILIHIRMIQMGNLSGNTLDALLSRLRGRPAPQSSLGKEVAVLAILAVGTPILALAIGMKRLGQAISDSV